MRNKRLNVLTTGEARECLNRIAAEFSEAGINATPLIFGSHRKPQAVIVPVQLWELIEDAWDLARADQALAAHDGVWLSREQLMAALGTTSG